MSVLARDVGGLGGHLLVREVEEVDHPRGLERDLAERLGGADCERLEEVAWVSHRLVNLSFAPCRTCSFSVTTPSASASPRRCRSRPRLSSASLALLAKAGYRGATFEQAVQARSGRDRRDHLRRRLPVRADARQAAARRGRLSRHRVRPAAYLDTPSARSAGRHRAMARRRARARAAADVLGPARRAGGRRLGDRLAPRSHPHLPRSATTSCGASSRSQGDRRGAPGAAVPTLPTRTATTTSASWPPPGRPGTRPRAPARRACTPSERSPGRASGSTTQTTSAASDEGLAPAAAAAQLNGLAGCKRCRRMTATKGIETDQAAREASGAHRLRALPRGVRGRRRLQALAREDGDRGGRPPVLPDHDEPPPAAHQRRLRAQSQQGRNVVVGPLVYSLALGMCVSDVSGKAIANLATEELKHPAPVFHGDTLFVESEVLEKRESQSKPDRGTVKVHTRVLQPGRRPSSPSSSASSWCRASTRARRARPRATWSNPPTAEKNPYRDPLVPAQSPPFRLNTPVFPTPPRS